MQYTLGAVFAAGLLIGLLIGSSFAPEGTVGTMSAKI